MVENHTQSRPIKRSKAIKVAQTANRGTNPALARLAQKVGLMSPVLSCPTDHLFINQATPEKATA